MSNQVNDENVGLLKQLVTTVQEKNDKEKVDNSIKMKPAKVIGVDEDTYKVFVYFIDDTEQNAYTFYNKSGEVLSEGDNVRVYYTTNPAKGWIGARCGEPNIKEITIDGGVGKPSPWDNSSEYFNSYEGNYKNIAGDSSKTYKMYAHAEGYHTQATGRSSHAEGEDTTASGDYSHAEGYNTTASKYSHAEGGGCKALGNRSHAEGDYSTASGHYSHAEGSSTESKGNYSHAEGYLTHATGVLSHAEGDSVTASGQKSHAEGYNTTASGDTSHAEGSSTTASGQYSHSEGTETKATGERSHAEGCNTTASGVNSHAEGYECESSGDYSHCGGNYCSSNYQNSFVHGYYLQLSSSTQANGKYCSSRTAFGQYNDFSDENIIFSIGNGGYDANKGEIVRSNAFSIDLEGNVRCKSINGIIPSSGGDTLVPYTTEEAVNSAKQIFQSVMEV